MVALRLQKERVQIRVAGNARGLCLDGLCTPYDDLMYRAAK